MKKSVSRVMAAVMSAAVLAGALTGCGSKTSETQAAATQAAVETQKAAADTTAAAAAAAPAESTGDKTLKLVLSTNDGSTKDDRVPTPWLNHNMATNLMWRSLLLADSSLTKTSPDLAESVEISEDGLTYTITMKDGLKWSDGEALTADDV